MDEQATTTAETRPSPPYIAFRTLLNLIERMEKEGVPGRIDKSYLDNLAGGYQGQVFTALRSLGLMEDDYRPSGMMRALVGAPDNRAGMIGELVYRTYPYATSLGEDATHGQLEEAFKENAPTLGAHARDKAITFFMHAAKYANLPLSKHFKGAPAGSSGGTARRRPATRRSRSSNPQDTPPSPPPTSSDEQRKDAYFKLLLGLAESAKDGDTNTDILNRIERLLGASTPPDGKGGDEA